MNPPLPIPFKARFHFRSDLHEELCIPDIISGAFTQRVPNRGVPKDLIARNMAPIVSVELHEPHREAPVVEWRGYYGTQLANKSGASIMCFDGFWEVGCPHDCLHGDLLRRGWSLTRKEGETRWSDCYPRAEAVQCAHPHRVDPPEMILHSSVTGEAFVVAYAAGTAFLERTNRPKPAATDEDDRKNWGQPQP